MKYDEIFTFDNLYQSHLVARRCKRNKKDVIDFENNLSENLWDLFDKLKFRSYNVSGYNKFVIYEPKRREIQALSYKDRIVQHTLCDLFLYPLITSRLIYDNGACQKGKGTDFALDRLTKFLRSFYKKNKTNGYILKMDIRHFFPSVDHRILLKKIYKLVDDEDITELLARIIESYNYEEGVGIPMGNQTSQLFALYYLDSLDRFIKEKLRFKNYVRYMDDMIIIHEDKDYLKECLEIIKVFVKDNLKLEFNQKTQIFPIKNGVDFLGFHIYMTDTGKVIRKVRQSTKKKFKKRMKKIKNDYMNGKIEYEDIKKVLPGFNGHLKRGHTYYLRKSVYNNFVLVRHKEEEL